MHYKVEALDRRGRRGDAMASVGVPYPHVLIAGQGACPEECRMSELAFDKEGNRFRFSRRTKKVGRTERDSSENRGRAGVIFVNRGPKIDRHFLRKAPPQVHYPFRGIDRPTRMDIARVRELHIASTHRCERDGSSALILRERGPV